MNGGWQGAWWIDEVRGAAAVRMDGCWWGAVPGGRFVLVEVAAKPTPRQATLGK